MSFKKYGEATQNTQKFLSTAVDLNFVNSIAMVIVFELYRNFFNDVVGLAIGYNAFGACVRRAFGASPV